MLLEVDAKLIACTVQIVQVHFAIMSTEHAHTLLQAGCHMPKSYR